MDEAERHDEQEALWKKDVLKMQLHNDFPSVSQARVADTCHDSDVRI